MDDTGGPQGEDLAETTRQQNSNLRRLIDAVGTLLAGSRELLKRLQPMRQVAGPPEDSGARSAGRTRAIPMMPRRQTPPAHRPGEKLASEQECGQRRLHCRHLHPAPPPGSAPKAKGGNPGVALQNLPIVQRGALFQSAPETPHGPRLPSA